MPGIIARTFSLALSVGGSGSPPTGSPPLPRARLPCLGAQFLPQSFAREVPPAPPGTATRLPPPRRPRPQAGRCLGAQFPAPL